MPSLNPFRFKRLDVYTISNFFYNATFADYKIDIHQKLLLDCTLSDPFLYWLLLVLLLNFRRWKRPVIWILILFWVLRFFNQVSVYFLSLIKPEDNKLFPYNIKNYYILCMAYATLLISQIVGDWYPLLRTKAVVLKKRDLILIHTTCIIFNISKILGIFMLFLFKPADFAIPSKDMMKNMDQGISQTFSLFFMGLEFSFISGIVYDSAIVYVLRKNVFKKSKDQYKEKQSFIEKFKMISEYRIFLSIIITFIAISVIALFIFLNVQSSKKGEAFDMNNTTFISYFELALLFNYYIMFVDQILLRFYTSDNNPNQKIYNNNINSNSINSKDLSYTLNRMNNLGNDFNSDDTIIHNYIKYDIAPNTNSYYFNSDFNSNSNKSSCNRSDISKRGSYNQNESSCSLNPLLSFNSRNNMYCDYPGSIVPPVPPIPMQFKHHNYS